MKQILLPMSLDDGENIGIYF